MNDVECIYLFLYICEFQQLCCEMHSTSYIRRQNQMWKKYLTRTLVCGLLLGACVMTEAVEPTTNNSLAYEVQPPLTPYAPGVVKPEGWLLDWARAAAEGTTGHLDEWSLVYGMGWKGVKFKGINVGPEGTGWPLEQCSYWLDGLVRLAYILDDPVLIKKVHERLDPVVDGALSGSPSLIHWRPMEQLDNRFDNWAHSHIARAIVAYYQATGDPRILKALVRVYKDYPLPYPDAHFNAVCGSVNLDPMLETYRLSGEAKILQNALDYASKDGFEALVDDYLSPDLASGHTVVFYENIRVPALLYPWTGNERHLRATQNVLAKAEHDHMLPMGLISGEEHAAGIGSTRNTETCNVAAGPWSLNWLLRITGEGDYGDQLERIFFNAGPSPIARDFQTTCYYQSANRVQEGLIARHPSSPGKGSNSFVPLAHPILCCVGNSNRILPNYIMHMWMRSADGGVAATLYGPSTLSTQVMGGKPVVLECKTNYPFEEEISILIKPSRMVRFPLHLRIPAWCKNPTMQVNGKPASIKTNQRGFVVLNRTWRKGDTVSLRFPMTPSVQQGWETDYPIKKSYSNYFTKKAARPLARMGQGIHNPWSSVSYGPLLFSLPIKDITPDQMDADAKWNYALDIAPKEAIEKIKVRRTPMRKPWNWPLGGPIVLSVPARQFDWNPTKLQPLPAELIEGGKPCTIELVPYGTTKFHISMFPVTKSSFKVK
jgi:uncharacterized protein